MAIVKPKDKPILTIPVELEKAFDHALQASFLEKKFKGIYDQERAEVLSSIESHETFTLNVGETVHFDSGLLCSFPKTPVQQVDAGKLLALFEQGKITRDLYLSTIKAYDGETVSKIQPDLVTTIADPDAVTYQFRASNEAKARYDAQYVTAAALLDVAPERPKKAKTTSKKRAA